MSTLTTVGFFAIALLLAVPAGSLQAVQRARPAPQVQAPAPEPARASRRKPRILHLPSPAQESPPQRDRRLARACQGLPNAGACLGYAVERPRPAGRARHRP